MSFFSAAAGLLHRIARVVEAAAAALAGVAIVALFGVVAFNVCARAVFDLTGGAVNYILRGAIELSSYSLLIAVFAAIAASLRKGLVRVDFIADALPGFLSRTLELLWLAALFAVAVALAWLFAHEGVAVLDRGEVTQDLEISLSVFYAIAAVECAAIAFMTLDLAATPEPHAQDGTEGIS